MNHVKKNAHVTILQSCPLGIIKKLQGCAYDSHLRGVEIDYCVIAPDSVADEYRKFPNIKLYLVDSSGGKVITRIRQFLILRDVSKKYQHLILRYPGADMGAVLLSGLEKKMIAEHHTLFVQEQRQTSILRAWIEETLGRYWLRKFLGHIAVTKQILDDVLSRSGGKFAIEAVIPNPYAFTPFVRAGFFCRSDKYVGIIAANAFADWHGLDRLIDVFSKLKNDRLELWVVGSCEYSTDSHNIKYLGKKNHQELIDIYAKADFAINSFGLDRLGMTEGSTLKLREYFDFCLPVVSPMRDSALSDDFKYLYLGDLPENWLIFLDSLDGVSFADIKKDAELYLGVEIVNDRLVNLLEV